MSVELLLDAPALSAAEDRLVRNYLSAGTRAVAGTTRRLEKRLEGATQGAVPGKLWRAWQSNTFPRSGPARNPVGTIYVKGGARIRGAIEFWTHKDDRLHHRERFTRRGGVWRAALLEP